jgi:hypothetical protein
MDFGFDRRSAITNPSKILLSQICTMSTFHMARALLIETVFLVNARGAQIRDNSKWTLTPKLSQMSGFCYWAPSTPEGLAQTSTSAHPSKKGLGSLLEVILKLPFYHLLYLHVVFRTFRNSTLCHLLHLITNDASVQSRELDTKITQFS